jgi:hypothetical protein
LPKINLSKIGSAAVAAATGVIMTVAPVFAETTPTSAPGTGSVITVIIDAMTFKFELSAQAAAELAAELAAKQAELATQKVEVATANDIDDGNVEEDLDVDEDADHTPTATTVTAPTKALKTVDATAGAEHEGNN